MTAAAEFVAQLDAENRALLERLRPDETLRPEAEGELTVVNLLTIALKNEIEATEIAARWLVATDDVDVKLALARQVGDEAKHYRMIAERLRELGVDSKSVNPLAKGWGRSSSFSTRCPPRSSAWRRASSRARPSRS